MFFMFGESSSKHLFDLVKPTYRSHASRGTYRVSRINHAIRILELRYGDLLGHGISLLRNHFVCSPHHFVRGFKVGFPMGNSNGEKMEDFTTMEDLGEKKGRSDLRHLFRCVGLGAEYHHSFVQQHVACYWPTCPPVIKHGNGKSPIFSNLNAHWYPFIREFPLPAMFDDTGGKYLSYAHEYRLMSPIVLWNWWLYHSEIPW